MFSCVLLSSEATLRLSPFIFYEISSAKNEEIFIFGLSNVVPFCVNLAELLVLNNINANVEKVVVDGNTYIFLKPNKIFNIDFISLKNSNKQIDIEVSSKIKIKADNEIVFEKKLETEIVLSHIENKFTYDVVYFKGVRNFVCILQNGKVEFADYYDEINVEKDEIIFMSRKNDILNHGEVACIKDRKFEKYLVYLDDYELKMKNEFVFIVFLDCLKCKNFKYCNQLLSDEIKQEDEKSITKFINDFDEYVPFKNYAFTFKKNTLSGVYKFVVKNNKIENIIHLMPCD